MLNEQPYEAIKQRILDNMKIDIDKREGSFTNNMISPLSEEIAKVYIEQRDLVNMSFIKNGFFNYLDDKCWEYGITRKIGESAIGTIVFEGENGIHIQNGTVLFSNDLGYVTLNDEIIENGKAELIVEAYEMGKKYNVIKNTDLTLRDKIEGITKVYAKEDFTRGSDTETDEELRERFSQTIKKSYTSGNVAHYEMWTNEVKGVGGCKIFPLKNGNGSVEVVITNSDMLAADTTIINNVKANIEENRPIGATITVVSATEKIINISSKITIARGYNTGEVKELFAEKLKQYLKEISFKTSYISISKLSNLLFETEGIFDYMEFKLNNNIVNIPLSDTEVPNLGTIDLVVI